MQSQVAVLIGIVIGVIIAAIVVVAVMKKKSIGIDSNTKQKENDFSGLISEQYVCDEIDMESIMKWFKDNSENTGDHIYFLAKPTEYTARLFALKGDVRVLDREHNLLQAIVDRKTKIPKYLRLVSYSSMPVLLSEKLVTKDYVIVDDN